MRYRSIANSLTLFRVDGGVKYDTTNPKLAYRFFNGVLNVGTLTSIGAGNEIDPSFAATDGSSLMTLYATGAPTIDGGTVNTALENAGHNNLFFNAPPIDADGYTTTAGIEYEVISGQITFGGKIYNTGDVFLGDGTDTELAAGFDSAEIALAITNAVRNLPCCDEEQALWTQVHAMHEYDGTFAYGADAGYTIGFSHNYTLNSLQAL